VPTTGLAEGTKLPPELERNAYFIAAEALTNAAKHADAKSATVTVSTLETEDGQHRLDVVVTDDGKGGAAAIDGHGIAGLEERVHGLGGTLQVSSPAGGPTEVAAHLPYLEA
jgi:signal transduction histidine kinase